MKKRKNREHLPWLTLSLLLSVMMIVGCSLPGEDEGEEEENEEEEESAEEIQEELLDLEADLVELIQHADLVPLLDVIPEEEAGNEGNGEEPEGENAEDEGEQEENLSPESITFEETLLNEVIKREQEGFEEEQGNEEESQLPQSSEEAWENISVTVTELHNSWDELRPQLVEEEIPPDKLEDFETELDNLTVATSENHYWGVLKSSNQLTGGLAVFWTAAENSGRRAAHEMKYHNRSIVLAAADLNTEEALARLDYMREIGEGLEDDLEEKEVEIWDELEGSMESLERVLPEEDINLIKLKAAEVMENLVELIETALNGSESEEEK